MKPDTDQPKAPEPKPGASVEPKPAAPAAKPGVKTDAKPDGKPDPNEDLKTLPLAEVDRKSVV